MRYAVCGDQWAAHLPWWKDPWESRSFMMSSCNILTRRLSAARLYSSCSDWVWGTMGFSITCVVITVNVSLTWGKHKYMCGMFSNGRINLIYIPIMLAQPNPKTPCQTSIFALTWVWSHAASGLFSTVEQKAGALDLLMWFIWVGLNAVQDHWCELNNRTVVRLKGVVSDWLQVNFVALHVKHGVLTDINAFSQSSVLSALVVSCRTSSLLQIAP